MLQICARWLRRPPLHLPAPMPLPAALVAPEAPTPPEGAPAAPAGKASGAAAGTESSECAPPPQKIHFRPESARGGTHRHAHPSPRSLRRSAPQRLRDPRRTQPPGAERAMAPSQKKLGEGQEQARAKTKTTPSSTSIPSISSTGLLGRPPCLPAVNFAFALFLRSTPPCPIFVAPPPPHFTPRGA